MYCKDDYILAKVEAENLTEDIIAGQLEMYATSVNGFLRGRSSLSKKRFLKFIDVAHLTDVEIKEHIEMTPKDQWAQKKYPGIQTRNRNERGWYAKILTEEHNRELKRKEMSDPIEAKVAYCRRMGITYGELQRRFFFKEVVLTQ